jgi:hypothetical protein
MHHYNGVCTHVYTQMHERISRMAFSWIRPCCLFQGRNLYMILNSTTVH